MGMSQIRGSIHYGAPELSNSLLPDLEHADIYSLGVTLLCAFYLCEPINVNAVGKYNKDLENTYGVLSVISEMLKPK